MANCVWAWNDNTAIQWNDATSIQLNDQSCEDAAPTPTPTGGLLAIQRKRRPAVQRGEVELICVAQISSTTRLGVIGRIKSKTKMLITSPISSMAEFFVRSKISEKAELKVSSKLSGKKVTKLHADIKITDPILGKIWETDLAKKHTKRQKLLKFIAENIDKI